MRGICRVAQDVFATQEGLCSMELDRQTEFRESGAFKIRTLLWGVNECPYFQHILPKLGARYACTAVEHFWGS
jgi:hypothetical protein